MDEFPAIVQQLQTALRAQPAKETLVLSMDVTTHIDRFFEVVKSGVDIGPWLPETLATLLEILSIPNWLRKMTAASALQLVLARYPGCAACNAADSAAGGAEDGVLWRVTDALSAHIRHEKREVRDIAGLCAASLPLRHASSILDRVQPRPEDPPHATEGCATFAGYMLAAAAPDAADVASSAADGSALRHFDENGLLARVDRCLLVLHRSMSFTYATNSYTADVQWHVAKAVGKHFQRCVELYCADPQSIAVFEYSKYVAQETMQQLCTSREPRTRRAAAEALGRFALLTYCSLSLLRGGADADACEDVGDDLLVGQLRYFQISLGGSFALARFTPFTQTYLAGLSSLLLLLRDLLPGRGDGDASSRHLRRIFSPYVLQTLHQFVWETFAALPQEFPEAREHDGAYTSALVAAAAVSACLVSAAPTAPAAPAMPPLSALLGGLLSSARTVLLDAGISGCLCLLETAGTLGLASAAVGAVFTPALCARLVLLRSHPALPVAVLSQKVLNRLDALHIQPLGRADTLEHLVAYSAEGDSDIRDAAFRALAGALATEGEGPSQALLARVLASIRHGVCDESGGAASEFSRRSALQCVEAYMGAALRGGASDARVLVAQVSGLLRPLVLDAPFMGDAARLVGCLAGFALKTSCLAARTGADGAGLALAGRPQRVGSAEGLSLGQLLLLALIVAFNVFDTDAAEAARTAVPAVAALLQTLSDGSGSDSGSDSDSGAFLGGLLHELCNVAELLLGAPHVDAVGVYCVNLPRVLLMLLFSAGAGAGAGTGASAVAPSDALARFADTVFRALDHPDAYDELISQSLAYAYGVQALLGGRPADALGESLERVQQGLANNASAIHTSLDRLSAAGHKVFAYTSGRLSIPEDVLLQGGAHSVDPNAEVDEQPMSTVARLAAALLDRRAACLSAEARSALFPPVSLGTFKDAAAVCASSPFDLARFYQGAADRHAILCMVRSLLSDPDSESELRNRIMLQVSGVGSLLLGKRGIDVKASDVFDFHAINEC